MLSWIAPLLLSFISTPIILKKLGNEGYGIYVVILGFISYSFAFGIGRAAAKYVAEYHPAGEMQKINDAVSSSVLLSLAVGTVGAVIVGLLAPWIVTDVLQITADYRYVAICALVLGAASVPVGMLSQVFQNVLQGAHSFGKLSVFTNVNWILLNVGNVILVYLGFGITALLVWNLIVASVLAVVVYLIAKREIPEMRVALTISRSVFRQVLFYGLSIFSYQLFANILLIFERAWVTREFGASETAYYLIPMMLAMYMHGFLVSLTSAAFPAFNELLSDRDRLLELYKKSTKIVFALTVFFAASLISGGWMFLRLWIDLDFAERSYPLLVAHTLTFSLIAIMIITWQINEAFRFAQMNALLTLTWAVVAIPLMIVSSHSLQSEGVAFSRFVGVVVTVPAIFYVEKRLLGSIHWAFWLELTSKVALAAGTLILIERVIFGQMWASWVVLIFGTVLGTTGYCLILLMVGFVKPDERAMIMRMLRRDYQVVQ